MERKPHSVSPQANPLTILVIGVYLGIESNLYLALSKTKFVKHIYKRLFPTLLPSPEGMLVELRDCISRLFI